MKLIIASNNEGKIREFRQLLRPLGYEVMSQSEAGICIDVEETGNTFRENAELKARAVMEQAGEGFAVIADDSGLCVDYLGGAPGVFSARYAPEGERKKTILKKLAGVSAEKRTARFVCCLCFMQEYGPMFIEETCEGHIAFMPRGSNGFGYDPIFLYGDRTFAEMPEEEKNEVSHRGKALRKLAEELK
jgi:XTP/dITP diphosphohydrolase